MQPHLPYFKPKAVILNQNVNNEILYFFEKNNVKVIFASSIESVSSSVKFHPDIQIAHIDEKTYVCEPSLYDYYKEKLCLYDVNLIKGERRVGCNYPEDIAYNIARVGKTSFGKLKCTDEVCLFHLEKSGVKNVNVSQGYAKCNMCIVDENSVITSDVSIHKKCLENDVDALLISPGGISLSGFEYGFIGGASFKFDNNTLCFFGDITHLKEYENIRNFLEKRNINLCMISKDKAEDFGSVILIF